MQKPTISKAQYEQLLRDERALTDMLPTLDSLEDCGEDCTSARAFIQQARDRITAIKRNFAPNMLAQ